MFLSPSKFLFLATLFAGTFISICANSWFGIWMGLEINLLSFIPLMTNSKNILSTEASLKYFLIQAIASSILLFSVIYIYISSNSLFKMNSTIFSLLINSTLLLKMGAAPFHFWFPGTMEGLDWINCLILMTWQKIAPLSLLSYNIEMNNFMLLIILTCVIIGSIGGLNQTSLRKIMAYSSINHLGWMLASMLFSENLWFLYFLIYVFLSSSIVYMFKVFEIYYINQTFLMMNNNFSIKFLLYSLLLSLGGLPPFLGFLPKWVVIEGMVDLNYLAMITMMVIMTLITLFFYLRISFAGFLFSYSEIKWNFNYPMKTSLFSVMVGATFISSVGLLLSTLIFSFL